VKGFVLLRLLDCRNRDLDLDFVSKHGAAFNDSIPCHVTTGFVTP
jgi:hypothetical protein